jgi:asparagine synthase (glutamine-hydrolysing)
LIKHLKENAREGKCVSDFCVELDAWHDLAASNQFSDLFFGEHNLFAYPLKTQSREEILNNAHIKGKSEIGWLIDFIPKKVFLRLCQCLDNMMDEIYASTDAYPDPYTKENFLYLDQRLNHALLPWRENFCSQVGFVHNPYLDSAILEFTYRLPPQLRDSEFLYKNLVKDMFPDLFSINIATSKDNEPDWHEELNRHKNELITLIRGTESRLDEIIPKKEIIRAIRHNVFLLNKAKAFLRKVLNYLRKRNKFANRLFNSWIGPQVQSSGDPDLLLIRLLIIRIYLSASLSDD